MKIAYFSRPYRYHLTSGGNMHVGQFLDHAAQNGYAIWTSMPDDRADTQTLPRSPAARFDALRQMDVWYFRQEWSPRSQCRFCSPALRPLFRNPLVAWELNTTPDYGRLQGASESEVTRALHRYRRYAAGCDIAFSVAEPLTTYARNEMRLANVVTIPNGSDSDHFDHPRKDDSADRLNVVWMGSSSLAWHDLDTLVACARLLSTGDWRDRILFHLIGEGTERTTLRGPNIKSYGPVSFDDLPALLAGMDVGLSLYQAGPASYGPGLKVFDYMAAGLAVVAYNQPVFINLFAEMSCPNLTVTAGRAEDLAAVLKQLYRDRDKVRACGQAGRDLIERKYNWRRAMNDTFAALRGLLDERDTR